MTNHECKQAEAKTHLSVPITCNWSTNKVIAVTVNRKLEVCDTVNEIEQIKARVEKNL